MKQELIIGIFLSITGINLVSKVGISYNLFVGVFAYAQVSTQHQQRPKKKRCLVFIKDQFIYKQIATKIFNIIPPLLV
jgi:hypothetical protein